MMRGKRRQVKRKWPRWLTPMCISKPSSVVDCGLNATPGNETVDVDSFKERLAYCFAILIEAWSCLLFEPVEISGFS
jgi:hypothetical protein